MRVKHFQAAVLSLACAALTACGNESDHEVSTIAIAKGVFTKDKKPNAQHLTASVQSAMSATDAPLILVEITGRGAVSVMQKIESNSPYDTYGTSDRRSITLRRGMLTATRGLGEDMMSSDVAPILAMVTNRRTGTAQRVHRYLDGENIIVTLEATCTVHLGGHVQVVAGELNRQAVRVNEDCRAQTTTFKNSYHVDALTGHILQSRQWINPLNGYIAIQNLR